MPRLNSYLLVAFALSAFTTASPLQNYVRATSAVPSSVTSVTITSSSPTPTSTSPTVPPNVANGTIITGCTQFFDVPPSMTCLEVEAQFNISDAIFHALNPEVNSICTNLIAGEAYCVANSTTPSTIPGNLAAGTITDGCTQFFTPQSGNTCVELEEMFNITATLFTTFNPEINADCTNLIAGEAYCVGAST